MILSRSHGRKKKIVPAPEAGDEEAYRLVGIDPVRTPEGCTGRDWLIYRIAQGHNMITGYRQGDLLAATAEVEKVVVALNERRVTSKGRPGPKPKGTAGATAPAAPAVPTEGEEGAS